VERGGGGLLHVGATGDQALLRLLCARHCVGRSSDPTLASGAHLHTCGAGTRGYDHCAPSSPEVVKPSTNQQARRQEAGTGIRGQSTYLQPMHCFHLYQLLVRYRAARVSSTSAHWLNQ
jgi:hypothetical protein